MTPSNLSRSIAAAVDADVSKQLKFERTSADDDTALPPLPTNNGEAFTSPSTLSSGTHNGSTSTTTALVQMPPYFKGSKSHYQKKYEKALAKKRSATRSPEKSQKKAKTIITRRTQHQLNVAWQNEQSTRQCLNDRFKEATKKATTMFELRRKGQCKLTYAQIAEKLNREYQLDGSGFDHTREKKCSPSAPFVKL